MVRESATSRTRCETRKFGNVEFVCSEGIATLSYEKGSRLEKDWDAAVTSAWNCGYTLVDDDPTYMGKFYNVYLLEPIH